MPGADGIQRRANKIKSVRETIVGRILASTVQCRYSYVLARVWVENKSTPAHIVVR